MSFPSYWQITAVCHTIDHWFYVKYFVTCNLIHQILHILHTDYGVFTNIYISHLLDFYHWHVLYCTIDASNVEKYRCPVLSLT